MIKKLFFTGALAVSLQLSSTVAFAQTEISFWNWSPENRTPYETIFAEFEKAHPDIKVNFEGYETSNYNTVLSTALASGGGPDVFQVKAFGSTEQYSSAGYLSPLNAELVPGLADIGEPMLKSVTDRADGEIYAVPFGTVTMGLFVNDKIFADLGLSVPTTWDELLEVSGVLKQEGLFPIANGMATGWMVEVFASALLPAHHGADFIADVVSGEAKFSDERYVGGLEKLPLLKDYLPRGFMGIDGPTMQELFGAGQAAMFISGSWDISSFKRNHPELEFSFNMMPGAEGTTNPYIIAFPDGGYALNAKSEKREASLELLTWMATKEYGDLLSAQVGFVSPIPGVNAEDPFLQSQIDMAQEAPVDYLMGAHFRYQDPTGSSLLQRSVQGLMSGDLTAAEVAAQIDEGVATYK